MSLPEFKLLRPRTTAEAIARLAERTGSIRILAGGTDLLPSMLQKLFDPQYLLDIRRIAELKGIRPQPDGAVEIGALSALAEIEHSDVLRRHYPVLAEAAKTIASPVLRNMGTIGGNICLDTRCLWYNQSLQWRKSCAFCIKKDGDLCHVAPGGTKCWAVFSGETPAALLCLDAEIEVASTSGLRCVRLADFYTGIGDDYRRLRPDELVTRVFLPASSAGYRGAYRKLRIRGSIHYPLAGVAVVLKQSNGHIEDARVGLTAVNPAPVLVKGAAELLAGKRMTEEWAEAAGVLAAQTAKPLTTSALTPEYRREMIRVFTKHAIFSLATET